jgi:hypothetical protein
MALTPLLLRLLQMDSLQTPPSTLFNVLGLGLAILTILAVTGCGGSGGEGDIGPMISNTPSPGNGGSNGGGSSSPPPVSRTASASLSWDPVSDVIGYIVHYGTGSPGSSGSCAYAQSTFSSSPSVTVSGLAANTTYYFAVSAFNGLESACSNEVTTVTGSA